ncbi:MAG: hypothetical protein OHK0053_31230 [Microscillaceae bacterium]
MTACGGGEQATEQSDSTQADTAQAEAEEPTEAPAEDAKKGYAQYEVAGYKARSEAFEADEKNITIAYVAEASDSPVRDIEISASKLNDASYLETGEAYQEYYKTMAANDKATITSEEKEGKLVHYYTFEDKMMGKAIRAEFLGKDNYALRLIIIEKSKGKLGEFGPLKAELDKFVTEALKK